MNRDDVMDQVVFFDVLFGNRQCVWRDVYCVDFRFWEGISVSNSDVVVFGIYI